MENSTNWNFKDARQVYRSINDWNSALRPYCYRPFDLRWIYYSPLFIERSRQNVMSHMLNENIALLAMRQVFWKGNYSHFGITNSLVDARCFVSNRGTILALPLYLYPKSDVGLLFDSTATSPWKPDPNFSNRVPNLNPVLVEEMQNKLHMSFNPHLSDRKHAMNSTFGPEDILAYIYAIFHSPTYRQRYVEFLKIDYPRVPLTSDVNLFQTLVFIGRELIALHLMESPKHNNLITNFPVPGDSQVKNRGGYPKYTPPGEDQGGRVYINRDQFFEGVPQYVWEFEIGGYQVLHKWLKDRRGRTLDYDDKRHYQQIVVALSETIRLMDEIDAAIPSWPIE